MIKSVWDFPLSINDQPENESRYERLALSRNPFPTVGVASENPMLRPVSLVDQPLQQVLRDFALNKMNQLVGIIGEYGSGKTHTLRLIHEKMQEANFPLRPKIVYVASAGYELYSLLQNLLDSFGRDELTKTIWKMLLVAIKENMQQEGFDWIANNFLESSQRRQYTGSSLLNFGERPDDQPTLASGFHDRHFEDYRIFLSEFAKRKLSAKLLREFAIAFLTNRLNCSAFLAAELFDATNDDYLKSQAAWDRLTVPGEKGAPYKTDQESSVMKVLLSLVQETGNYDSFALLVDEFEATVSATLQRKQQEGYLRSLRLLHDAILVSSEIPILTMLAMTGDAWRTIKGIYPALAGRVKEIELPLADKTLAIEIISRYLESERLPGSEPLSPLFPFSESTIDALLESLPTRSLRILLVRCRTLIEEMASIPDLVLPVGPEIIKATEN